MKEMRKIREREMRDKKREKGRVHEKVRRGKTRKVDESGCKMAKKVKER